MTRRWVFLPALALALGLASCGGDRAPEAAREDPAAHPTLQPAVDPAAEPDTTRVKLGPGMPFPSVPLLTLDEEPADSRALVEGRPSLVLLVDVDCEVCKEFLEVWFERRSELPPGFNVIGIVRDPPDYTADWVENSGFPFPAYCDPANVFAEKYVIRVTPSVVGTYADGVVAYVGKAVTPEFTPAKAVALLAEMEKGREARDHAHDR